ncbi:hypothetical protein D3C86_2143400 [compost metagenome]
MPKKNRLSRRVLDFTLDVGTGFVATREIVKDVAAGVSHRVDELPPVVDCVAGGKPLDVSKNELRHAHRERSQLTTDLSY